jgi:hypothetical protein
MSVIQPRSRVTEESSQRATRGCWFGSKAAKAKRAIAQIAARVQRKSSGTGFRAHSRRSSRREGVRARTRWPVLTVNDDKGLSERVFTIEEANAALEEVRPLAEEMVKRRQTLAAAVAVLEQARLRIAGNGGGLSPQDLAAAQEEANREALAVARCVERIIELGAQVKDLDQGLVDFPSRRGGEEILLCWHVGEDEIGYWHGTDEGFAGRKPLDPP